MKVMSIFVLENVENVSQQKDKYENNLLLLLALLFYSLYSIRLFNKKLDYI